MNDAFEATLVDAAGNPLVPVFAAGRDAFFNVTNGNVLTKGTAITILDGNTVRLDMSAVPVETVATLVFRPINNDADRGSKVVLESTALPTAGSAAAATKFFVVDDVNDRTFRYGDEGLGAGGFATTASGAASNPAGDKVWVIDDTTNTFDSYTLPSGFGSVRGVAIDSDGRLWATSTDAGIARFTFAADRRPLLDRTSLRIPGGATAAAIDNDGFFWRTTFAGASYKIDPETVQVVDGYPIQEGVQVYNYQNNTASVRSTATGRTGPVARDHGRRAGRRGVGRGRAGSARPDRHHGRHPRPRLGQRRLAAVAGVVHRRRRHPAIRPARPVFGSRSRTGDFSLDATARNHRSRLTLSRSQPVPLLGDYHTHPRRTPAWTPAFEWCNGVARP